MSGAQFTPYGRMSHEWNCVCVRCERLRDWLDAVDDDPRDDAERMRDAFSEGRSAYDPANDAD